ncbi:MAG: ABC transporter ATP-binding protein, partial [Pontimonas sp.]
YFARELFSDDAQDWVRVGSSVIVVAMLLHDPNGLASLHSSQARWLRDRLRRDRAESTAKSAVRTVDVVASAPPTGSSERSGKELRVEGLSVRFGGVVAVNDLSITVSPGEVVGLIGPNGAGKTTVVDAVSGMVRAEGRVFLEGERIDGLAARRRACAGLTRSFQSLELFDTLTVRDNLAVAAEAQRRSTLVRDLLRPGRSYLSEAALSAITELGLESDLDHRPDDLPFGRRRLVGLARALAAGPSVVLLDEPVAGLDANERQEFGALIGQLAHELNLAVLLIEHDVGFVLTVCDRVVALDKGKQIASGTPAEVRENPMVISSYLGSNESSSDQVQATAVEGSPR